MGRLTRRGFRSSFHLRAGDGGIYIIVWVWFNGMGDKLCMWLCMQTEVLWCNNKEYWITTEFHSVRLEFVSLPRKKNSDFLESKYEWMDLV